MRQFIRCVTVTGADNSTTISDMLQLSAKYPYVEWGILLSLHSGGGPRFPGPSWLNKLAVAKIRNPNLHLSGHLCGTWVREICLGTAPFGDLVWLSMFDRYQLNFHAQPHHVDPLRFRSVITKVPKPIIFQADGVNDDLRILAQRMNTPALMDRSHGSGRLPGYWPTPLSEYCGYAGGLSADNVAAQLEEIAKVIGTKTQIWIDAETRLRKILPDEEGSIDVGLDLDKVGKYLLAARPYVMTGMY